MVSLQTMRIVWKARAEKLREQNRLKEARQFERAAQTAQTTTKTQAEALTKTSQQRELEAGRITQKEFESIKKVEPTTKTADVTVQTQSTKTGRQLTELQTTRKPIVTGYRAEFGTQGLTPMYSVQPQRTLEVAKKPSGLSGFIDRLGSKAIKKRAKGESGFGTEATRFGASVVLGGSMLFSAVRHPIRTAKGFVSSVTNPVKTIKEAGTSLVSDPVKFLGVATGQAAFGYGVTRGVGAAKRFVGKTNIKATGTLSQETAVGVAKGKFKGQAYQELSVQQAKAGTSQIKYGKYNIYAERTGTTTSFRIKSQKGKLLKTGKFKSEAPLRPDLVSKSKTDPKVLYRDVSPDTPYSELLYKQDLKQKLQAKSFAGSTRAKIRSQSIDIKTKTKTTTQVQASPKVTEVTSPTEYKFVSDKPTIEFGKAQKPIPDVLRVEGAKTTKIVQPRTVQVTEGFTTGKFDYTYAEKLRPLGKKGQTQMFAPQEVLTKPTTTISPTSPTAKYVQPQFSIGDFGTIQKEIVGLSRQRTVFVPIMDGVKAQTAPQGIAGETYKSTYTEKLTKPSITPITETRPVQATFQSPIVKTSSSSRSKTRTATTTTQAQTTATSSKFVSESMVSNAITPSVAIPVGIAPAPTTPFGLLRKESPRPVKKMFSIKKTTVKSKRAYRPTLFTAGFGIKGTSTKGGVSTGLGIRRVKKKKKKKKGFLI